ncbi:MAG: 3-phosphoshikimate 1-carboxyvinyltransferase [Calditrichaeota bacterium]|nr:3-phosphoshikimate 1-carboxyvinyltransferase [Calditrichota bacterium]
MDHNGQIAIVPGRLMGEVRVPPSKSITHRALILAALSRKPVKIAHPLDSEDTRFTLQALQALGYEVAVAPNAWQFTGQYVPPRSPVRIFVGNSGTTARLMTAFAALHPGEIWIDGSPRMRQRPMAPLLEALRTLGARIDATDGKLPLWIRGGNLQGGRVDIDASESSQYVSALLLIAPRIAGGIHIQLTAPLVSRAYVQLTLSLLQQAGVRVDTTERGFRVAGEQQVCLPDFTVEGDVSSASYFLIGAAITGGRVTITNVGTHSIQGDREVWKILAAAGARVVETPDRITVSGNGLKGVDWDMSACPDLVPGMAVMALFASSKSRFRNVQHLRFKESDRIAAIRGNIQRLGGKAEMDGADLVVQPGVRHGAVVDPHQDHRIAMSFALAGLRLPGVVINDPDCVGKSYPTFWEDLSRLHHPLAEDVVAGNPSSGD